MCKYGTTTNVAVTIPAELSFNNYPRKVIKPIDSCIASIVKGLEDNKVFMSGSCCGHGKNDGIILLQDNRTIIIKQGIQLNANIK